MPIDSVFRFSEGQPPPSPLLCKEGELPSLIRRGRGRLRRLSFIKLKNAITHLGLLYSKSPEPPRLKKRISLWKIFS